MTHSTCLPTSGPWAEIDRAAITHNLNWLKQRLPPSSPGQRTRLWAVVKADAYGHGLVHALAALQDADGLGVTTLDDALRLRSQGWTKPLLLLSAAGVPADALADPALGELHLVIDEVTQLEQLESATRRPGTGTLRAWLRHAGRLSHLGFDALDYAAGFRRLQALKAQGRIAEAGHLHHYAAAEDPESLVQERQEFARLIEGLPGPHCTGNSAALCGPLPEPLHPGGHWLRCGLLLYGASALPGATGAQLGLRPAMSLRARLVALRPIRAGQSVGYGDSYRAARDTWIGTVGMGYSHGLPRGLWERGRVRVGEAERIVPLAGRVAMDCFSVDLGPAPREQVGDLVTLWGQAPGGSALPVETVAEACGTIAAELFTRLTARLPLRAI